MTQATNPAGNRTTAILAAALAAAALTLAATLFSTNQRDLTFMLSAWETFSSALNIAILPVAIYFIVVAALGFVGGMRTWWTATLSGLLAVVVGSVLGYMTQVLAAGLPLDGQTWGLIFGELIGLNFPFVISGLVIAALTLPTVYRAVSNEPRPGEPGRYVEGPSSVADAGSAFVRIPSTSLLEGLDAEAQEGANAQWEAMVAKFEEFDWGTQAITEAEHEKDSVFIADTALVLGEQVVLARPKGDTRRVELGAVRDTLNDAGAVIDELDAPAVFNPADVVEGLDGTLYVGIGGTTNASAVRALRRTVGDRGYRVVGVPVENGMHLADVVAVLPDGTKLVWQPAITHPEVLGEQFAVTEPRGAAVVSLSETVIAVPASAPKTRELVENLGYQVEVLDVSFFEQSGGSLPRMSLRSRD